MAVWQVFLILVLGSVHRSLLVRHIIDNVREARACSICETCVSSCSQSNNDSYSSNEENYLLVKLNNTDTRNIDTPKKLADKQSDIVQLEPLTDSVATSFEETPKNGSKPAYIPPKEEWFPYYHIAPPSGWMNDPNGLIYFEGYYHAFYQYNPDATYPNNIHWGHVRSKNMLDWENLPIAIEPSIPEDKGGCFTGSAIDNNGTMTIFYTGNAEVEVQCIAHSDDTINFVKEGKVLGAPPGIPNFRDPKVFREGDAWFMVVGAENNKVGEVRLFRSEDLYHWKFQGVLAKSKGNLGFMWECPDLFPLGDTGKHVLMISPQGVKPKGYKYRNLYQSGYFVGEWSPGMKHFTIQENFTEIDNGFDFYAPQSFLAPGNRRIQIGWMDMWETPMPEANQGWVCTLTLPRVLTLSSDNKILVNPIEEVKELRQDLQEVMETTLYNEERQLQCGVTTLEITTSWSMNASNAFQYGLRLGDEHKPEEGLFVYADNQAQRLVLDRRFPRYGAGLVGYRSIPLKKRDLLTLRVFFDHSSAEVFVNDGEAVMSTRIYPLKHERCLSLFALNGRASLNSSSRWKLVKR